MNRKSNTTHKIKRPYEGDVVAFRLEKQGHILGVLTRVETTRPRKPYGIYVYFFGPFAELDTINFSGLKPENRICRLKTSALGIYDGNWTKIGEIPGWNRNEWPFPEFYYGGSRFGTAMYKVRVSESDLVTVLHQMRIEDAGELDGSWLHGYKSAEDEVARIISQS